MQIPPIHPPAGWLRTGLVLSVLTAGAALAQTTTVTFNVNTLRDTQDANPGDGNCRDENGQCSIRASVMEANGQANRNDKLTFVARLPAGNYGFSIMGTNETDSRSGDLNFRGGMNFTFEGESQQGTVINLNGIDRFARLGRYERLTLRNLTIKNGVSQSYGGAIQVDDGSGATLVAEQVTFSRNQSNENGGAINSGGAAVLLRNVTFEQNRAQQLAGGLLLYRGNNQLENVVFRGNSASEGGGLWNRMPLNASKLTFEANTATERGGGLSDTSGALFLRDSVFTGNTSQDSAGGAYIQQSTLERVLFQKNRAVGNGGGLYTAQGNVNLLQSAFVSNEAQLGGGLFVENGSRLENLTFSDNRANSSGGSIYFYRNQSSLSNSTLALSQSQWGNVVLDNASLILKNSIIHTAKGRACRLINDGRILSSSFNLVNDGTCGLQGEGDLQRTDPRLAALQTFEGLPVHLPLPDSPALNAVDPTLCALNDQRDVERPQGGNCDIGAVEITAADVESLPEDVQAIVPGAIADFRVLVDNWDDNFKLSVNGEQVLSLSCCGNDRDPYIIELGSLLKPGVNTLHYTLDDVGGVRKGFKLQLFAGDQMLFWQECYTDQPCFNRSGQDSGRIVQDQELQVVLTPDLKVQVDDRLAEQALAQLPRGIWRSAKSTLTPQSQTAVGEVVMLRSYVELGCVDRLIRTPNQGDALTFDELTQGGDCESHGKYQLRYLPEKDQMLMTYYSKRGDGFEFSFSSVFDRQFDPPSIESFTATPAQGTVPLKVTASFKVQNPSGLPMECEVQVTPEQRYRTDCLASSVDLPLEKAGTYDLQLNVRYNNQLLSKSFRVVAQEKTAQPKTASSSVQQLGLPSGATEDSITSMQFDPQGRPVVAFTRNRQTFLSRWNGQAWQALGTALSAPSRADLDLYIGSLVFDRQGFPVLFTYETGRECGPCAYLNMQVRRWNGKNWQVLGKITDATVVDLYMDPQDKLYLLGNATAMQEQLGEQVKVRSWDGRQWVQLGKLPRGTTGTLLFQQKGPPLLLLEQFPTDLLPNNPDRKSLQQWDGSKWTEVKNSQLPVKAVQLDAVKMMDRKFTPYYVYAPYDPKAEQQQGTFARRWNGKSWESLGLINKDGTVRQLLFDDNNRPVVILSGSEADTVLLYVAGNWRTVGNLGNASRGFISGKRLMTLGWGSQGLELQTLMLP